MARKRPSINTTGPGSIKRRKQSAPGLPSSHPLRQTSFPPAENRGASRASAFSPPAEASVNGRSSVGPGRKKRGGRKSGGDTRSQAAASAVGARQGKQAQVNGAGAEADEPEDEDDDEDAGAEDTVLEGGAAADDAQLKLEKENVRMLIEAFNSEQSDRYEMWRRVKLNKATVRRVRKATRRQVGMVH